MFDSRDPYSTAFQKALVTCYQALDAHVDMQRGAAGRLYRQIYFLYKRINDRHLLRAAEQLLRPNSVVVDIGANIGFFSVSLCLRHSIEVIAFEPEPRNFLQLCDTIRSYKLEHRIHPQQCAVSDTSGISELFISDLGSVDHKLIDTRSSRSIQIRTMSLDDFLDKNSQFGDRPISLIKMDIQGAELLALAGMKKSLARLGHPPLLVEYSASELPTSEEKRNYFVTFESAGYFPHTVPNLIPVPAEWYVQRLIRGYSDIAMISSHP